MMLSGAELLSISKENKIRIYTKKSEKFNEQEPRAVKEKKFLRKYL
jgi:hypothetical protein